MTEGTAQSVHTRLLTLARQRNEDFNLILNKYAIERFLYRLSISKARRDFLLKGAQLFHIWFDDPHRPTRDADLLGLGPADEEAVGRVIAEIAGIDVDEPMVFDPGSVTISAIREGARYDGLRVRVAGSLGNARCPVQLDIGFGDAVSEGPDEEEFPVLLPDQPAPNLLVYPRVSVMAEKLEAIVHLGMANSRMKDYYDLLVLLQEGKVDAATLASAIAATFARRETEIPESTPVGLSESFAGDSTKQAQWRGFADRNGLSIPGLADAVREIRDFVADPMRHAREER